MGKFTKQIYMSDNISHLDTSLHGCFGVYPERFVHIAVLSLYLSGRDFPRPAYIITLGMHPPATMIGHHKQWIFLGPFAGKPLIMGRAFFNPFRYRRSLCVVRKMLGRSFRVELQLSPLAWAKDSFPDLRKTAGGRAALFPSHPL